MPRQPHSDFETWMLWLVANVVPWWVGCVLLELSVSIFNTASSPGLATVVPLWGSVCALVGVCQGWVLKQRLTGMKGWPLATVLGGAIGFLGFFTSFAAPLVMGGAFGLAQWLILRHRVRRAWLWILAQILAAIAGAGAALLTPVNFMIGDLNHSILVMGTAIEVAASFVTGSTLIVLLRQRHRPSSY